MIKDFIYLAIFNKKPDNFLCKYSKIYYSEGDFHSKLEVFCNLGRMLDGNRTLCKKILSIGSSYFCVIRDPNSFNDYLQIMPTFPSEDLVEADHTNLDPDNSCYLDHNSKLMFVHNNIWTCDYGTTYIKDKYTHLNLINKNFSEKIKFC